MSNTHIQKNLDALTGLRFVAAFCVFLNHAFILFPIIKGNGDVLGNAGVGFFFVLSGFILTYVYVPRRSQFSVRDFYLRRFARIWPLHLATMLVVLFLVVGFENNARQPHYWLKMITNVFLIQSWIPDVKWVFSLNAPAWSLSVEAFFYLLFPALLFCRTSKLVGISIAFCVATLIALISIDQFAGQWMLFETKEILLQASPFFRLYDFVVGMLCGAAFIKWRSVTPPSTKGDVAQILSIAACVVYFVIVHGIIDAAGDSSSALLLWLRSVGGAPLFAVVIYLFADSHSMLSRTLSTKWAIYLGETSFAFYLIHQPILRWLHGLFLADSPWAEHWMVGASLILSLFAAMLLHHLVELPSRLALIKRGKGEDFLSCLNCYLDNGKQLINGRFILTAVVACTSVWFMVQQGQLNGFDQQAIEQIVDESATEYRGVRFDQDAVLLGVTSKKLDDGSWQLSMAWELKEGRRPTRFMHICDANGKIVARGDGNRPVFENFVGAERVIDTVNLPTEQLNGAAFIAVGFFEPQSKQAPIYVGNEKLKTARLKILDLR